MGACCSAHSGYRLSLNLYYSSSLSDLPIQTPLRRPLSFASGWPLALDPFLDIFSISWNMAFSMMKQFNEFFQVVSVHGCLFLEFTEKNLLSGVLRKHTFSVPAITTERPHCADQANMDIAIV